MTNVHDLRDRAWLDLVAPEHLPPGYAEHLATEAADVERHERAAEMLATAKEALTAAIAGGGDLMLAVGPAASVAAAQTLVAALPPVRTVPDDTHERIAEELTRGLSLPALTPSLWISEQWHHIQSHSRDLPPVPGPNDVKVAELFEQACAALSAAFLELQPLRLPLNGSALSGRVRAVRDYEFGTYKTAHDLAVAVSGLVAEVDRQRVAEGLAHRCPQGSGQFVRLDPVTPGPVAWSLPWALRGNGRPVHFEAPGVLAGVTA